MKKFASRSTKSTSNRFVLTWLTWFLPALGATTTLTALIVSCTSAPPKSAAPTLTGPRVSIMTYNVENLFDTKHDAGKDDYTFLPLSAKKNDPKIQAECAKQTTAFYRKECLETDWNDAVLAKKLDRVADVIQQVGDGRGPDIQILDEVENKNVLEMLRTQRLAKSDYKTSILIEGADNRGIDPAILSRLPQWGEPKLHTIPYKPASPEDIGRATQTRGILEARLVLPDGQKVSVFAVHLPAQANPSYLREQAVQYLNELQRKLPSDVLAIAGGDFNITGAENDKTGYFSKVLSAQWLVSHLIGCQGCEGTHYYHPQREWSFLDALLFSKSMQPGVEGAAWKVDPASVRVPHASKYQVNNYKSPARFDENKETGVSDHWPMYAEIVKPQATASAVPSK